MNIVVVVVYWSMLHQEAIDDCEGDILRIINVYWAHLVPGFSVATNFAMTDVVIRSSHYKGLVIIAILYGFVNYHETKARGKPLYSFMKWEDSSTVFIYGGLIAGFTLVFVALSHVTVAIKRAKNIQSSPTVKTETPKKKKK